MNRVLPLAPVVVLDLGLVVAVALVALDRALLPVAGVVLSAALVVGLLRRRGRWLAEWLATALAFRWRTRVRDAAPVPDALADAVDPTDAALLRLLVGDVRVVGLRDHDGRTVGAAGHDGVWSVVLVPDEEAVALVADPDAPGSFPLATLAGVLTDRGVVLDGLVALWHTRDVAVGSDGSAAVAALREVRGPLPAPARRTSLLVVRLDPARCPDAVAERGGGIPGAQRALLGALARVRRASGDAGVPLRALGPEELLEVAVEVGDLAGLGEGPRSVERWEAVVVSGDDAEVGQACWAVSGVTGEGPHGITDGLAPLAVTGADSTTLVVALEPGRDDGGTRPDPVVRAAVRVTGRSPGVLADAGDELADRAARSGLRLHRLDGRHAAALAATLPLPAPPAPRTRDGDAVGATLPVTGLPPATPTPPVAPAGVLLGADPDRHPVELALLRPVPTRVVLVGGLSPAREIVLRAAATGIRVVVVTGRAPAWEAVRRAAGAEGIADPVTVHPDPPAGLHHAPSGDEPLLVVHDRGATDRPPPVAPGPWRTTLVVLPALVPAVAGVVDLGGRPDDTDLVLLTRRPPHESELAGRLWRLGPDATETLRTLPDHGLVALGRGLWRRVDRVTAGRESAILGPVRLGD